MRTGLTRQWFALRLGVVVSACGRLGIEVVDETDAAGAPDAGGQDAAAGDAGGDGAAGDAGGDAAAGDAGGDGAAGDAGGDGAAGDAGGDAAAGDAGAGDAGIACSGGVVLGLCWYLGAAGASCNAVCSSHGGFDTRTASYVGTTSQGGSLSECTTLISVLVGSGTVGEGMRTDSNGFGCHVWTDGALWWLASPSFTPTVSGPGVRIVCACAR